MSYCSSIRLSIRVPSELICTTFCQSYLHKSPHKSTKQELQQSCPGLWWCQKRHHLLKLISLMQDSKRLLGYLLAPRKMRAALMSCLSRDSRSRRFLPTLQRPNWSWVGLWEVDLWHLWFISGCINQLVTGGHHMFFVSSRFGQGIGQWQLDDNNRHSYHKFFVKGHYITTSIWDSSGCSCI